MVPLAHRFLRIATTLIDTPQVFSSTGVSSILIAQEQLGLEVISHPSRKDFVDVDGVDLSTK